jgi:anti-sigma regulatory factor (Ser/Thr protein kinase)
VLYPEKRGLVSWLEDRDSMSEAGLGLTILKALTDEMAELDDDSAGTTLRLTKHLST